MDAPTLAPPNPAIAAAAQQAQNPTPAPPQPTLTMSGGPAPAMATPAAPDVTKAHVSVAQRLLGGLFGSTPTQYTIDPKTGVQTASSQPQKPGAFFRNLLGAAVLGGASAAGTNPEGGFWGGVGTGGRAVQANAKQQDLQRQQQAQQQFKNQQDAAKNQREADAATTEDTLRKAQIAQANMETYRTNVLTQGESLDTHNKVADMGKAGVKPYVDSGIKPLHEDVPETEMNALIAAEGHGGKSTLDWEPTGVKAYIDPKTGQPGYQQTYSAYDPKGPITVSKDTIAQWKKDGLDTADPLAFGMASNMVNAGKTIDASQYVQLKKLDTQAYNDNVIRQKNDADTEEGKARVNAQNATAAHEWAETTRAKAETGQINQTKNETAALDSALTELSDPNKANGDFSKLSAKSKVVIGESAKVLLPSLQQEAKDALTADPTDSQGIAKGAMQQMDTIRELALQAITGGQPQGTMMINPQGQQVLVPADKLSTATQNGYKPVSGPAAGNPNERVTVKVGNNTQTMTRADFAANKAKWANIDTQANPTAAAWANATVSGPAGPSAGPAAPVINVQSQM